MLGDSVCHELLLTVTFGCSIQWGSLLSLSYSSVTTVSSFLVFVLQRPKLTPCNICRLFCGQCLTVTSTVKQTGWGENFIATKFLFVHLLWALKLICQIDGFLLCLYRKCPTIKKKKEFLWDEAVMVFVLHPQRCKGDS